MKFNIFIILACLIFSVASFLPGVLPVAAHESGPPYIQINNQYAQSNPLLAVAQPTKFEAGEDVASASGYPVGTPVTFAVDERFFPNPYAQAQNQFGLPVANVTSEAVPAFRWDFRDGTPVAEGDRVSHVFTKSGTYVVELAAKFAGKTDEYARINSIEVHVIPGNAYVFPVPKISVNGKTITNRDGDIVPIKPALPVSFEASAASETSVSYQWDFGDQQGKDGKNVAHRYARNQFFPVVTLRATDAHNISVMTYALLDMPFENPNVILRVWYAISDFVTGIFYRFVL